MRQIRQLHFYLGCLFSPLILYFALSGAWQSFRFNDIPKGQEPTAMQTFFHGLSQPHTNATFPGRDPRQESSLAFKCVSFAAGLGLAATAALGMAIAWSYVRSRKAVLLCLAGGLALPILLLWLR